MNRPHATTTLAHLTAVPPDYLRQSGALHSLGTVGDAYKSGQDCERTMDMLAGYPGWMPFKERPWTFHFDPLAPLRSEMREEVRKLIGGQRRAPEEWRAERIAAYRREHSRLIGVDRAALRVVA